jgi:hypothetical protein
LWNTGLANAARTMDGDEATLGEALSDRVETGPTNT